MPPTILVAGATGNTGRGVVETLSDLLKTSTNFSRHRILALTRSSSGTVAKQLAELPSVEVVEKNWADITPEWLQQNNVVRAFIASHVHPGQFAEESAFHLAALTAGVEYVVRISTTAANVRPDCPAFYPRAHWALETLLGSPEFQGLRWTSLQPNVFTQLYLYPAAELIKNFRKTGRQDTLKLMASEDAPVASIDPYEVGILAARLLTQVDVTPHHGAKYVLNGPEDITGRQIVTMVEQCIGTKLEDVRFQDLSFIDQQAAQAQESKSLILSIKRALETAWEGKCTASTTSKEVFQIFAPKRAPDEIFKEMLED
ncbi:Putative NmrA-like domain, NAD(P)-binding domain superfamily [Colletotrichum destructivum]|uniref:NmrA-like domain, NAD(P)-binding domain superfamily n=1 Tax=Colletotrichum destructivum TaxID=34406 RepID=A0AAX4IJC0_9PEZI|nr:Putative NmrA-like domain, NAD(P)-binding domain superfamily [Colletotrichum destructivum]